MKPEHVRLEMASDTHETLNIGSAVDSIVTSLSQDDIHSDEGESEATLAEVGDDGVPTGSNTAHREFGDDLYGPVLREVALLSKEEEELLGCTVQASRVELTLELAQIPAAVAVFVDYMVQADLRERPISDALFSPLEDFAGLTDDEAPNSNSMNWREAASAASRLIEAWRELASTSPDSDKLKDLRRRLADAICRLEPGFMALGGALRECQALDKQVREIEAELGAFHADILNGASDYGTEFNPTYVVAELDEPVALTPEHWQWGRDALRQLQVDAGVDLTTLREACERATASYTNYNKARERMIKANLRLAHYMAHRLLGHGLSREDLIQEAILGLMRAVDKFDYRLGYKFSTYAVRWIRQSIGRALADASRTIRVPAHMHDNIVRVRRRARTLEQELGREATSSELAKASGLSEPKVNEARRLGHQPLSLDTPLSVLDDAPLHAIIADASIASPSETVHNAHLTRAVAELVDKLPPREAFIIRLRHGIGGVNTHTLEEIGRRLGITRERTRQLEQRAFTRLRELANASFIDGMEI